MSQPTKQRPMASKHPKEVAAEILRARVDDHPATIREAVDAIFEALGIDVVALDLNVDHRTYRDLQSEDRTAEYVKEKLTRGVSQYLADTETIDVTRTRNKERGVDLFRASLWVIRTPEGSPGG